MSFEVATVRSSSPTANGAGIWRGGPGSSDPERMTYSGVPLKMLVMLAYGLPLPASVFPDRPFGVGGDQVLGPPWIDTERFDIAAKIRPGGTKEQVGLMLQDLLAERFGLRLHREIRQVAGLELVVDKGGLKLKETVDPDAKPPAIGVALPPRTFDQNGYPVVPPGLSSIAFQPVDNGLMFVTARSQSISDIIMTVILTSLNSEIHVVDKTGLTGKYDFHLDLAR